MSTIINLDVNIWIYFIILIISLFGLSKYQINFNMKDLLNSFIRFTNKMTLIFIFITFLFMFIFELIGSSKVDIFFKEVISGLIYYMFFKYFVFFGLRMIHEGKDFFKNADLFGYSYIQGKFKEGGKK